MTATTDRIVSTDVEMEELGEQWRRLSEASRASAFSSYDFNLLAWRHFHRPTDRLFIVVIVRGPAAEVIAPFCITRRRWRGIPLRVVRFIGVWEGDRPALVTSGDREDAWRKVLAVLLRERGSWDALHLTEQPAEGPEGRGWSCLSQPSVYWEQAQDATDYFLGVEGTWEELLGGMKGHTRRNLNRDARLLQKATGGYRLESIREPGKIKEAVARFAALERSGWKAQAQIGLAKDARHLAFYEELLQRLADQGRCGAFFLTCDAGDVAGDIWMFEGDVAYARHTAYAPTFASCSPGNVLHVEVFRHLWNDGFKEIDLLGMKEGPVRPMHKAIWATGRRDTVEWTGYRRGSRAQPLIVLRWFRRLFAGGATSRLTNKGDAGRT